MSVTIEAIQHIHQVFVYLVLFAIGCVLIGVGVVDLYLKFLKRCRVAKKSSVVAMIVLSVVTTIYGQKRVYVDSSVEQSGEGTKELPYKEICDALSLANNVTSRLEIVLAPGTYGPVRSNEPILGANGDPISIELTTYRRDEESAVQDEWVIDGMFSRDESDNSYALYLPYHDRTTNRVSGITVRNCTNGIGNFFVRNCVITNCSDTALSNCHTYQSLICDSGIGLDGGFANNCTFTRCSGVAVKDSMVELCYITNNTAIAICGGSADTCLIKDNDYGVNDAKIISSSIVSNRKGGIFGKSIAINTLAAYNMDGAGKLNNFIDDNVFMTNCCTAPLPTKGAKNLYSEMPIYPDTYALPIDSPIFRNGDVELITTSMDLNGNRRIKDGCVDIGAFYYSEAEGERPPTPKAWWSEKTMKYIDALIEAKLPPVYKEWRELDSNVINYVHLYASSTVKNYIPYSWMNGGHFYFEYKDIMGFKSGKKDTNGEEITWWDEYILGTDPLNDEDCFRATITINQDNNNPQLSWHPDLKEDRKYLIFGKIDLADEWVYIQDGNLTPYRFFKVKVDLPR